MYPNEVNVYKGVQVADLYHASLESLMEDNINLMRFMFSMNKSNFHEMLIISYTLFSL